MNDLAAAILKILDGLAPEDVEFILRSGDKDTEKEVDE